MGEAKRRRASGTSSETSIRSLGSEAYRGHLIETMLVRLAGVPFWRVDVTTLALDGAEPLVMLQTPVDRAPLQQLVTEAKAVVGHLIRQGTGVDAVTVPIDHAAREPVDRLVMTSATGKRSVCPGHWATAKAEAKAGRCSLIVFGILLIQRFTDRLYHDGLLAGGAGAVRNSYTMNMLLDSYAPLCCWLGDEAFATILADSNPQRLLERARSRGVL
jgi:hypothetical protein